MDARRSTQGEDGDRAVKGGYDGLKKAGVTVITLKTLRGLWLGLSVVSTLAV